MNTRPDPFLSHLDSAGNVRMVDISLKKETVRFARASAFIRMSHPTLLALLSLRLNKKGDAFSTARIAGILAAKKVSELIPLTHSIPLTHCEIIFHAVRGKKVHSQPLDPATGVAILSTAKTRASTGVEMEALTAVSVAALTIYDMIKSVQRDAVIEKIQLEEKSGGKSGHYKRDG